MSDITKRINALFAKAESTDSAEEAQALFAKAEELMLKHANGSSTTATLRYPGALALIDRTPEIRREMGHTRESRAVGIPKLGYDDGVRDGRNHSFARGEVGR